jgi:hypothetical protein
MVDKQVPVERQIATSQKWNALSVLALIFAAVAFIMLFFSPFGPISSRFIPFHPMGWAGMFVFLAMLCGYGHKYQQTKDNFWFILALMFFPVLLSDLYFFPIPTILGFGMGEWMGVQSLITFVSFTIMSKAKVLRYSNLGMLFILPVSGIAYFFPKLGLSIFLMATAYVFGVVVAATLSYYAYKRKEYFMIVGAILNFLVSMPIPMLYIAAGYIPFGWTQPLMAVVTDRIAIFGRILMVVSLPALTGFLAKKRNRQDIVNESIQD